MFKRWEDWNALVLLLGGPYSLLVAYGAVPVELRDPSEAHRRKLFRLLKVGGYVLVIGSIGSLVLR